MSKVDEIKMAIDALPEKEYVKLRKWFSEKDGINKLKQTLKLGNWTS